MAKLLRRRVPWTEVPPVGIARLNPTLAPKLTAVYLLNEGGGNTAYDLSGRGNHGVISEASWNDNRTALDFTSGSGLAHGVEIPSAPTLEMQSSVSVFAEFIARSASSSGRKIVCKHFGGSSTGIEYLIHIYNNRYQFRLRLNGSLRSLDYSAPPALNTLTTMMGTYDGATMRLYINDRLVASTARTGTINETPRPLLIGNNGRGGGGLGSDSNRNFNGLIFTAGVSNVALSEYPTMERLLAPKIQTVFVAASQGSDIEANTALLSLTAYTATLSLALNIESSTEVLLLETYPAEVTQDVEIGSVTSALVINSFSATVSSNVNIQSNPSSLLINELSADISIDYSIAAVTESLILSEYTAALTIGSTIASNTAVLDLVTYPATFSSDVNLLVQTENLNLITFPASIITGSLVVSKLAELTLVTYPVTFYNDPVIVSTLALLVLDTKSHLITTGPIITPGASVNSLLDTHLGNVPDVDDPKVYEALLNVHSAIDIMLAKIEELTSKSNP